MVAKACGKGLPCLILCPPNISGPNSPFLSWVLATLRGGRFVSMDNGGSACNLVDVNNLAYAIQLALTNGPADAQRIFVTDRDEISWKMMVDELRPLSEEPVVIPAMSKDDLIQHIQSMESRISVRKSLKHLLSSEVRAVLREDPLWASIERVLHNGVRKLGLEEQLRNVVKGSSHRLNTNGESKPLYDLRLIGMQLRGVRHLCEKAAQELGYQPILSFRESMKNYRDWYRQTHGMNTDAWQLLKHLY